MKKKLERKYGAGVASKRKPSVDRVNGQTGSTSQIFINRLLVELNGTVCLCVPYTVSPENQCALIVYQMYNTRNIVLRNRICDQSGPIGMIGHDILIIKRKNLTNLLNYS